MTAKRLITFGLALIALVGVALAGAVLAGAVRHHTRPRAATGIPPRDYQFRSRSQPQMRLSKTALLMERQARGKMSLVKIRHYQLGQRSVEIGHCSISRVSLQLRDNGRWVVSLRADQNPVPAPAAETEAGADAETEPMAVDEQRYTEHIHRNRFHVKFRCYGAYREEEDSADETTGKPVLFTLEPKPFWVQKGEPYALWQRGDSDDVTQYLHLVDRVELEFGIETATGPTNSPRR